QGDIVVAHGQAITVGANGQATVPLLGFTVAGQNAPVTGTVTVPAQVINIPGQTLTINLPRETTVTALVQRSVNLDTKVDEIADFRGKVGLTNTFFGPNILLYATGGAAIGHFTKTLTVSQTSQVCTTTACTALTGTPRTDTFSATSGDTRLGWVVGTGFD